MTEFVREREMCIVNYRQDIREREEWNQALEAQLGELQNHPKPWANKFERASGQPLKNIYNIYTP